MGTTDVLTAKYFCESIGVSTVETASIRKSASIEGSIEEYGQQNISTLSRNLLNVDEILRIPSNKLLVILRGNKPLLLDKVMYKNHPLSKKLSDCSIQEYKPEYLNYVKQEIGSNIEEKQNSKNNNIKGFKFF